MSKLTFEILLSMSVLFLLALYVRDRYRNIRAKASEWLRMQRIKSAAFVVGPPAVPMYRKRAETKETIPSPTSNLIEVKESVNIVHSVEFANVDFDVPTYVRRYGRLKEQAVVQVITADSDVGLAIASSGVCDDELVPVP